MEIFKGGGEGMEAALFQKTLHAQLNTCGIQHVLALVAVDLCRRRQAVAAFVLVHQRVNVAIADVIHHLHQIAHRPGVDGEAKFNLRGHFITVGDCHFAHVVAETHHFQVAGVLLRDRLTHPGANAFLCLAVLPVAGHHGMLLTHARADEAELAAAVRGLVQVHEVHVDAVPRQGGVELRVELQQRFVEDSQAVDPHFCWREGVQPHHQASAFVIVIGIAADVSDFVRGGTQRLQHQFARQFGFRVQRIHNVLRVFRHLLQRFRSVQMLAANHKPHFIIIKNGHYRVLNVSGLP